MAIIKNAPMKKVALALLSFISFNALSATWIRCESCQAPQSYAYAQQSGLSDEVVVFSLANQMAAKFFNQWHVVGKECHEFRPSSPKTPINSATESGCSYQIISTPMALSPEEGVLKGALEQFYADTNGTMKSLLNINGTDLLLGTGPITGAEGGSAYDFVNSAIFQGLVITQANDAINNINLVGTWANLGRAVVGAGSVLALGADGTKLTVTITFSDGTSIVLVYTESPRPDSITTYTAENRPIVNADNLDLFIGEMRFNSDSSLENFFSTLRDLGVPIVSSSGQSAGTGSCTRTNNGITCKRPSH